MITVNNIEYEIIENYNDGLDETILTDKLTDYYNSYDYILGDWAYGKLRLKGFNDKNNKNFNNINDYAKVNDYIKEKCAYGCKYFIIKKVEK